MIGFDMEIDLNDICQRNDDGRYEVSLRLIPGPRAAKAGARVVNATFKGSDDQWYCNGTQADPITSEQLRLAQNQFFKHVPIRKI